MARLARIIAVGEPHHVTQRGNQRLRVFDSDTDRLLYLQLLQEHAQRRHLRIWGYCLMDNHVHLIAVPLAEDSLARTLREAHSNYARYINTRRQTCGHFWQNRYYSCPLDEAHRWVALAYVERNPVRAGILGTPEDYYWSSAQAHLRGRDATGLVDMDTWNRVYTPERWADVLRSSVGEEALRERLREATRTGRPLGDQTFLRKLEHRLGRSLERGRPGPRGAGSRQSSPPASQLRLAVVIGD